MIRLLRFAAVTLVVGVLATALPALAQDAPKAPLTEEQKEAVRALVREVIRDNPELILEAVQALDAKEKAETDRKMGAAVLANRQALERDKADPIGGNPDGDVTVVEFFDYRCPYCKEMTDRLANVVKADGKVRVVYKEFPILGPASVLASRAAVASLRQSPTKYLALHKALMGARGQLDEAAILRIAASSGFDADRLKADMAKPETEQFLARTLELGKTLQIGGTPAFIIGNRIIAGATDEDTLREAIAAARKKS